MNFVDYVYKKIEESNQKFLTSDQILKLCGAQVGFDKMAVASAIKELVKKDKLVLSARSKYSLAQNASTLRGRVMSSGRGFVFVRPENDETDDVFVLEKDTSGAVHGDLVLVRIFPKKKQKHQSFKTKDQSRSGEIIKILEHTITKVVGIYASSGGGFIVVPDDTKFADSIFIEPGKTLGAKPNQKVVVKITSYPSKISMAKGEIIEILGDNGDAKIETLSIARSFNLTEKFPESVIEEAKKVSTKITSKDLKNRQDFRNDLVITIDGEDAKDFDDAISLKKLGEDKFELSVHIADVSNYVKEDSEIDKEAFRRGTSVYFPDMVIPMLPEVLCNNICSLRPDEERLTLSVVMVIDSTGKVLDYKITKGIIKSCFRMTYRQVTKIFAGDKEERKNCKIVVPMLENMKILAKILENRRNKAGNIDFDIPETQIDVNEKGQTIDIYRKPREDSDKLIEQFMVITNEVVAKHYRKKMLPFVYRVHESPSPEKLSSFCDFVSSLGLKFEGDSEKVVPKDFQTLLRQTENEPYYDALSKIMLRSMQKALYYEKCLGHFGLALKDYCHFTSPIRRYPDLMIHRIISYDLAGALTEQKIKVLWEKVKEASEQSSLTERNADEAERTVDSQKMAEFMEDKIGQVFDAKVSGVSEGGVFVALDNTVEGLIYREYLPQDSYIYDEKRFCLAGKRYSFKIGDKLKVKLVKVDIITRHIDFAIFEEENTKKQRKINKK
ncbi:MAG: ribonuclease R [Clostridia bacterium]|nr:ribonuclease R [Clostridia bacterium]